MDRLQSIATMLGNQAIPLKSGKRIGPNGISYTDKEIEAARTLARLAFQVFTIPCTEFISMEEIEKSSYKKMVLDVFETLVTQHQFVDVAQCLRHSYRTFEQMMLSSEKTKEDFPMINNREERIPRSQSSLNVMFRKAIRGLVDKEVVDTMFKMYQNKEKKEAE